jgi:riboflavin biosynthesis pyrimidine reductase
VRQIFPVHRELGTSSLPGPGQPGEPAPTELITALGGIYAYPGGTCVRGNMIASVDGAIEVKGRSGGLSGAADRLVFTVLRSLADVILVGAGTARAEKYGKATRVWPQLRQGRAAMPPIAVVTRSLGLDLDSQLITGAGPRTILLTTSQAKERLELAAVNADVIVAGEDSVPASVAIEKLTSLGHRRILVEGGPTLLGQLAADGHLDELCVTTSPLLEGGHSPGRMLRAASGHELTPLSLVSILEDDGFVLSRYRRAAAAQ